MLVKFQYLSDLRKSFHKTINLKFHGKNSIANIYDHAIQLKPYDVKFIEVEFYITINL